MPSLEGFLCRTPHVAAVYCLPAIVSPGTDVLRMVANVATRQACTQRSNDCRGRATRVAGISRPKSLIRSASCQSYPHFQARTAAVYLQSASVTPCLRLRQSAMFGKTAFTASWLQRPANPASGSRASIACKRSYRLLGCAICLGCLNVVLDTVSGFILGQARRKANWHASRPSCRSMQNACSLFQDLTSEERMRKTSCWCSIRCALYIEVWRV